MDDLRDLDIDRDNIKIYLIKIYDDTDWIKLAQERIQWMILLNTKINNLFPESRLISYLGDCQLLKYSPP
jgi:hypothetical protein